MLEKINAFRVAMIEYLEDILKNYVRKVILCSNNSENFSRLKEGEIKKVPKQFFSHVESVANCE